jgi:23S rRNA (adenine2503-C2)-methyltransferase
VSGKQLILDLDLSDIEELTNEWDLPSYRIKQIWQGIYQQLWTDFDVFTNLPQDLRTSLHNNYSFTEIKPMKSLTSSNGDTVKTLFELNDGNQIEAVLMKYSRRRTLCISTQSGCGMDCSFCATGQMGLNRNLSSGEIIAQVLYYARSLVKNNEKVTNIVIMGMGEPFHNYEATMQAIDRLNHPEGMNLGERRFTISTVGLIPQIKRFASELRQINLAVSLHAVDNELRSSLLPINKKYPVDELLSVCEDYVNKTRRRITFEWALINDVNDSISQARDLAQKIQGMICLVNIIRLNPTSGYSGSTTSKKKALAFCEELQRHNIPCTIRLRRGIEIQGGCGQLTGTRV